MVLGVPYEETPEVEPEAVENGEFWGTWMDWAEQRRTPMAFHSGEVPVHLERWIAVVESLTMPGKDHVVVMRRATLFHDPAGGDAREFVVPSDVKYAIVFEVPDP